MFSETIRLDYKECIMNKLKLIITCILGGLMLFIAIGLSESQDRYKYNFQIKEQKQVIDVSKINIQPSVKIPNEILERMKNEEKARKLQLEQEKIKQEQILLAKTKAETTNRGTISNTKVVNNVSNTDNEGWIKFTATFYDNCVKCCGKTTGITAMGTKATAGRTVAMPSTYKFGTKIRIKGMGTYIVEDRGGAIKGNRIDIFVNSHAEALRLGKKTIYLKVIK